MSIDAILSISGVAACAAGAYFVLRAYGQTTKSAEPDPERVKRFVDSAPLDQLQNIQAR
ncbi:hypothetical protein OCH239_09820 [Roseivivax halodurans JCM 10272]|uniref:Uncharacterized protein n=1 Tax=Roseivivax halodurans JCM 10272 TaxID=1449350 RepID=X7ECA3_9RHOB|nr:hypothetical protein [Roseivivax halodurans]ETX13567.1 hypothetical protein OCH239_09820 [Roseivivax halodurans JCM 10272]